jgi:hypothetical protein
MRSLFYLWSKLKHSLMKRLLLFTLFALSLSACSTCYKCTEEVVYYDNNGNPIDSNDNVEEFCTADAEEVKSREDEGASCQVE